MQTIAWLFIIVGAVLVRQVSKGRALDTPIDLRDMFVAAITMDTEALKEVNARTGESAFNAVSGSESDAATTGGGGVPGANGSGVLAAAVKRGSAAKGYKFGTFPPEFGMGPNWYDCSGLVSRALGDVGLYKGGRALTTYTWPSIAKRIGATRVNDPQNGDIVVWQRGGTSGHMGIVTTGGNFYGAQSSSTGIKELPMSGIRGSVSYWRLP